MDGNVDFDLLNEKINPRKRLKGRRGFQMAGPKGSQRKIFRGRELHTKLHPGYIDKFRNELFEGDDKHLREEIDDGYMEVVKKGKFWTRFHPSSRPVCYSLNKRKRWELEEQLKKKGGYYSHIGNSYAEIQKGIEDQDGNINEDVEAKYKSTFEKYDQVRNFRKNRKKKKKKKKKKNQHFFLRNRKGRIPNYAVEHGHDHFNHPKCTVPNN